MKIFPDSPLRKIALLLTSGFFTSAGITHFTNPDFFIAIVPPYLPAPRTLVYISGVFEVLGGLGVLHPRYRRWAGIGLLLLLVAVYPANIHMALNPDQYPETPPSLLYARLPFQFLFGWLVWIATRSEHNQTITDNDATNNQQQH